MAELTRSASQENHSEEKLVEVEDDVSFYRQCLDANKGDANALDDEDFKFLVEFSIHNVAYTIYQQLQNNSFFTRTEEEAEEVSSEEESDPRLASIGEHECSNGVGDSIDSEYATPDASESSSSIRELVSSMTDAEFDRFLCTYETKDKLRLIQVYLVVVRTCMPYYHYVGYAYYNSTIEHRRWNQVPIQPNDKCYSLLCGAIRNLFRQYLTRQE